ncbi:hypothetical protein [Kitasatospora cineracea]|uniref:hypothetical protein n=1 Tax=Kitasatospora cineracea TaxID=88074 RepID=UPI0036C264C7
MEKIIPTEGLRATLLWPVTGLCTGTPVLVRKLTAPQRQRRAEAAELKAKRERILAEAAEAAEVAFAKKLIAETDPVKRAALVQAQEAGQIAAREVQLEQDKAARAAGREKLKDTAGAAALLLVVGGPLIWSLARPWIGPGVGLAIGVWWIAALIHAPAPGKDAEQAPAEPPAPARREGSGPDVEEDWEETAPTPRQEPSPTPADARLAVVLLGAAGGHVALTAVTAHLAAQHPLWKRSGKAVKALLGEAGVRVRGGVRVEGVSVEGIHRDDVPPLPSPSGAAPGSVVAAGQSNNNNANNAPQVGGGEGFITRPDPDNPARTIVVHTAA